ncbi:MAG: hypothetical protein EXS05_16470 [Planctomycetaceae bacterium]|nr:hypothetical protein [Planctomycetaceae bacterium]
MLRVLCSCAWLLLCQAGLPAQTPTNQNDLRDWHRQGLPLVADWNTTGYTPTWHIDQVRKGHRFLPSFSLPFLTALETNGSANWPANVDLLLAISASDQALLRNGNLPICLRTKNLCSPFTFPAYRLPMVVKNIPLSPLVWFINQGILDDAPTADVLGPPSIWASEGKAWGKSLFMQRIQAMLPNPEYVIFLENNEAATDDLGRYTMQVKGKDGLGLPRFAWLPDDVLGTRSLRMRDHVRPVNPTDFLPEYWALRGAQYRALYDAFEAGLTEAWQGRTYTAAYGAMDNLVTAAPAQRFGELGYAPELTFRDAGSPSYYIDAKRYGDFTSLNHVDVLNYIPAWEEARRRNPKSYREVSLNISDGSCFQGAQTLKHEVMTPSRYEGHIQWLLWSIHDPGVPVLLRHFSGSTVLPSTPMFRADQQKILNGLGADGIAIKAATNVYYVNPITSAVDRICTEPTLRKFWLNGSPVVVPGLGHPSKQLNSTTIAPYPQPGSPDNRWRVLDVNTNPLRSSWQVVKGKITVPIKVWAVATRLNDEVLLYLWSPCKLTGNVTVTVPDLGTAVVTAPNPWGYWLLKSGTTPQQILP